MFEKVDRTALSDRRRSACAGADEMEEFARFYGFGYSQLNCKLAVSHYRYDNCSMAALKGMPPSELDISSLGLVVQVVEKALAFISNSQTVVIFLTVRN